MDECALIGLLILSSLWESRSESKSCGDSGDCENRELHARGEGTSPFSLETILVVDLSAGIFYAWAGGTGIELLWVALEFIINVGAAHVWAKTSAFTIASSCAKIFRSSHCNCNEHGHGDQKFSEHLSISFELLFFINELINYNKNI